MEQESPTGVRAGLPSENARRHIDQLYEIGKLLVGFEGVERTFPLLMAVVAQVLSLRTVFLLEGVDATGEPDPERPRLTVWRPGEVPGEPLEEAANQAAAAYAYLVGARQVAPQGAAAYEGLEDWLPPRPPSSTQPAFITLPLVSKGHIFGTLQVEAAGALDEERLAFLDAVANQLSVALDRHYGLRREVSLRERAETLQRLQGELLERERQTRQEVEAAHRRQTFLAEATAVLAGTLDYHASLPALARLLVPAWADCCAIDLVQHGPAGERVALMASEPPGGSAGPESFLGRALAMHPWVALPVGPQNLPEAHVTVERAEWTGFPSNLRLALRVRGRTVGVLSLLSSRPRHYGPADEALFEALAQRIATAVDTARLYQQAQEAVRWREELLAVVSHDLKTPLLVVRLNTEMLLNAARSPEEERRKHGRRHLEFIMRAVEQMRGLIGGILDRAREQGMPVPLAPMPLPVDALLQQAIEVLRPLALMKYQDLAVELSPALPRVSADRERILQVLANLVGNAIKFTPKNGTITLRAKRVDGMVRISVKDTGPGISSEDVPHLFERFWRATSALERGTGLGLSIAKSIVEAHGGALWVETQEGAGSTFFFTLPCAEP